MSTVPAAVPFVDFHARVRALRSELDAAVARVLDSGWFILGPEGEAFEREFASALGAREAVAVANGTDALQLGLRALGVGEGDEVVTTSISAAFSALAIQQAGARPVFVDVDPRTLNLDPARAAGALTPRTRALVPVHLYGHPAEMAPLLELVEMLLDVAGGGRYELVPFPEERKRIDIGDFHADTSKACQTLGWRPRVPLREGLSSTVEYYRLHREQYL